ncbi:MAG TPA: ABC-type transport auxiliary lipoprotein family protein [Polyangiaceae bacterium]
MNRLLAMATIVMGAYGCALVSRGEVLSVRYFSPEPIRSTLGSASAQGPRPAIRLGRVRGAPYLRERIAHRDSEYEVGFYDDRAWTERPEAYVRRALVRKLFEERGFVRMTGGTAPTLELEVVAFEELRMPPLHAARVEVHYQIRRNETALAERTIRIDRPVAGGRFEDVVAAFSGALDEATGRIADDIAGTVPP